MGILRNGEVAPYPKARTVHNGGLLSRVVIVVMSFLKFQVAAFIKKGSTAFLWMVLVLIGISVALVGPVIRVLKLVREGERS